MISPQSPSLTRFSVDGGAGPLLLVLPALGTPARSYRRVAEALARLGCSGAILEWPGTGAHPVRAERGSDWGYRHLLDTQVLPAINAVATGAGDGPQPVVLVGHSLGAHLALMSRALGTANVRGIVTIAAGSPYYRVFKFPARQALLYLISVVGPATALFGYFPGQVLGFAGREPKTLMREWAQLARTGQLVIDGKDVLRPPPAQESIPVKALCLAGDIYAPRAAAIHLLACAAVPATAITQVADPAVRGHFDWLRAPDASATLISDAARSFEAAR